MSAIPIHASAGSGGYQIRTNKFISNQEASGAIGTVGANTLAQQQSTIQAQRQSDVANGVAPRTDATVRQDQRQYRATADAFASFSG